MNTFNCMKLFCPRLAKRCVGQFPPDYFSPPHEILFEVDAVKINEYDGVVEALKKHWLVILL